LVPFPPSLSFLSLSFPLGDASLVVISVKISLRASFHHSLEEDLRVSYFPGSLLTPSWSSGWSSASSGYSLKDNLGRSGLPGAFLMEFNLRSFPPSLPAFFALE